MIKEDCSPESNVYVKETDMWGRQRHRGSDDEDEDFDIRDLFGSVG